MMYIYNQKQSIIHFYKKKLIYVFKITRSIKSIKMI